jgi:hypothetical protein
VWQFLDRFGKGKGGSITDFCLVSGFNDDTIYGWWQRNDSKCTAAHKAAFERTLALTREQFLERLARLK